MAEVCCTAYACADVFYDVSDGQLYKNKFFLQNPACLKLILYVDPFEVVNPKCKHKILVVYLSLANLPPRIRSNTDHMSLVMLCREKVFTHFGHDKVFSDLKDLEENGITWQKKQLNELFSVLQTTIWGLSVLVDSLRIFVLLNISAGIAE